MTSTPSSALFPNRNSASPTTACPRPLPATCWPRPMHWPTSSSPVRRPPPRHCPSRSEEHTSELQSQSNLVCRLLLEKKKKRSKLQGNPIRNTEEHIRRQSEPLDQKCNRL